MRLSRLFTKTRREAPKDEVSRNADLLIRGGFIHKEMAGVYSFLPLGLAVLENINRILREEMNAIGGVELRLTGLQSKELWEKTDRWSDEQADVWFKTQLKNGGELGLGWTHEEPLTALMTEHVDSHRDLPVLVYQIQTKFRNETRAKSGLVRGREFLMKDLYSFARDDEEHRAIYERVREAYKKIFERAGIGTETFVTFASGGAFSKFSEEFQTVSEAGEDTIFLDRAAGIAVNEEVYSEDVLAELGMEKNRLEQLRAIEVGNIFNLGTRFSEPLALSYLDEQGKRIPIVMGSYGLGPTRLMGTIVEVLSDDGGMVWPREVAPFSIHLVVLPSEDKEVRRSADTLFDECGRRGISVLYDDREASAGEKFADADLLGMPVRAVVSQKTIAAGGVEVKERCGREARVVSRDEFFNQFRSS